MRAHTITTITRPRRKPRHVVLAVALGICALAIPATATAQMYESGDSSANAITGGSSDSSQPARGSDYSSVNSIVPLASEQSSQSGSGGSADVDSGFSSVNAITGSPADSPTFVSGSPSGTGEGFDWPSAVVGAGAGLALAALGGAALLTARRRTAISPSAS
jgi:hypothetical protein